MAKVCTMLSMKLFPCKQAYAQYTRLFTLKYVFYMDMDFKSYVLFFHILKSVTDVF